MKEVFETKLWVNSKDIDLHPFVEQFVAGAVTGAVRTLKGIDEIRALELRMVKKAVTLLVNGKEVALTEFPNDILASTVAGVVSSLKGVDEDIDNLQLDIKVVRGKT